MVSVYRLPHSWLRARAQTARLELRAAEHGREKLLARDRAAPAHSQAAAKSTFGSCDDQCGQLLDDVLVGSLSKRFCRREHSRALQPLVANAEYERLGEIPWSWQLGQRPTTWLELEAAVRPTDVEPPHTVTWDVSRKTFQRGASRAAFLTPLALQPRSLACAYVDNLIKCFHSNRRLRYGNTYEQGTWTRQPRNRSRP